MSTSDQDGAAPWSIAIIGAGLGGLTLTRVLQLRGVNVTLYEREPSSISRNQGGTLDMHAESGQKALNDCKLTDEFWKIAHPEADAMKIVDKHGRVTFEDEDEPPQGELLPHQPQEQDGNHVHRQGPPGGNRPEVDRGQLRQILIDSLLPNTIKWSHDLSSCTITDNKVTLHFSKPAITKEYDVVVGADGTWSRVRPLLSPAKPEYTGVTMVDIQFSNIDSHPELSELVGRGTLSALDDNKGLIAQRNSGEKVRVYVTLKAPSSWSEDSGFSKLISSGDFQQAQQHLLTYFSDWSSSLQRLIIDCDVQNSSFAVRPLFSLPSHSWDSIGRVTLLGDAAHVMVPFAGEGANLAMLDAAELGDAIAASKNEEMLKTKVGEYEKVMLERANTASEESLANMNLFISEGGAEAAGALMKQIMAGPPPGA